MMGTPISKESAELLSSLRPIRKSNGRKRRPVWPVIGSP
jgi:hypothetical protein